jgi:hypothetical protein
MMLDRERLSGYVGCDSALELEFLKLLQATVESCLASLSNPTSQIYRTLHAAKAGLSVATCEQLRHCMSTACELTGNSHHTSLTLEAKLQIAQLRPLLAQLQSEIACILSANDQNGAQRANESAP